MMNGHVNLTVTVRNMSGDGENVPKKTDDEDLRLRNWSTWLAEWNRVQGKAAEKRQEKPGQVAINFSEGVSNVNAEKAVLRYARIPTKFDKYRGNPDFWKLPTALPHKCKCGCFQRTYFTVKTKEESNVVPTVELVGIPDYIRHEKNILEEAR
jgi:hypothetical protein